MDPAEAETALAEASGRVLGYEQPIRCRPGSLAQLRVVAVWPAKRWWRRCVGTVGDGRGDCAGGRQRELKSGVEAAGTAAVVEAAAAATWAMATMGCGGRTDRKVSPSVLQLAYPQSAKGMVS